VPMAVYLKLISSRDLWSFLLNGMTHGISSAFFPCKCVRHYGKAIIRNKFTQENHPSADLVTPSVRDIKTEVEFLKLLVKRPGKAQYFDIQKQKTYDTDQALALI